ncbi:hypothetical protein C8J57DRAFT_1311403 [Mycena rebaudengoi]|nr:hypothetical protein C8J57DRAFT_1311403 [Mycena rebaudengoi]
MADARRPWVCVGTTRVDGQDDAVAWRVGHWGLVIEVSLARGLRWSLVSRGACVCVVSADTWTWSGSGTAWCKCKCWRRDSAPGAYARISAVVGVVGVGDVRLGGDAAEGYGGPSCALSCAARTVRRGRRLGRFCRHPGDVGVVSVTVCADDHPALEGARARGISSDKQDGMAQNANKC